jgi:hypothetical protein
MEIQAQTVEDLYHRDDYAQLWLRESRLGLDSFALAPARLLKV